MEFALRPFWDLSDYFSVTGNTTAYNTTHFGKVIALKGMPYVSDARLSASADGPYTGGAAYVLDTDSQSLVY